MPASVAEEGTAHGARGGDGPAPKQSTERHERLPAWLQFPRRIVLILVAFALATLLIQGLRGPLLFAGAPVDPDWSVSWAQRRPVGEIVSARLPNTLTLLGAAGLVGLLMALVVALVAVLVHRLEERTGPLGSILKGLGRLWILSSAAMPVFGIALLLILVSARFREWGLPSLPMGGMYSGTPEDQLGYELLNRLRHLILPSFVLALLPAALTAQAAARALQRSREQGHRRLWLIGVFRGLGTVLGQAGGWLSATVVVETVFSWPGIGRLMLDATLRRDLPVVLGALNVYAVLVLLGRLTAELFRWLERLVQVPASASQPQPNRRPRTARTVWVVVALALLLIPLGVVVAGLSVDPGEAAEVDAENRLAPPSPRHPWGTDNLGRDVQARVLRGGLATLGAVGLLSAAVVLPGGLGGAVCGWLASRRTLWSESLADLLLLPADVLLFIPALPGAIVTLLMLGGGQPAQRLAGLPVPSWIWVGLICAPVLLPRAVRAYQTLWMAAPQGKRVLALGGTGAFLLGLSYAGLWLAASLEWLGLAVRPPSPTLGGMVDPSLLMVHGGSLRAIVVLWACSLSLYAAADALISYFQSKEVLARLNE